MIGQMLGPYLILEKVGEGGMGEVYKAKDTRLDRSVAIKILPPEVSADPDRRARFEREAKTIAALNHPHICTLHDVGEHDGATFLVMEHLAGETLAQRVEKGPLPLEQALTVATEIADALSAAHRQGVIHRDLKPGNVMLTKSGAKLLDFGLAKLTARGEQAAAASLASVPTKTRPLTSEGAIVGTLQYMAPEQVEGKPADARTDLWALGAILYEMLTGRRAFAGDSAASLIGNIMNAEPPAPPTAVQPLTPPGLDRLVRQCLAKAPDDRPDTAHDLASELRWIRETSGIGVLTGVHPRRGRSLRTALVVGGVVAAAMAGAGVMWLLRAPAPRASVARPSLDVRPAEELNAGGRYSVTTPGGTRTALAWSPDGHALIFVGRRGGVQQLYVRRLDGTEASPLPNTEGAQVPAVSADGQSVAFWAAGAIRRVLLGGGPVMDLASGLTIPPTGLAWSPGGQLFFGRDDGRIWMIPPGGAPAAVTTPGEAEVGHTLPWPLPGGRAILYTVRKRNFSWGDEEVVAHTLATGQRTVLLRDATDARYVPSGHLVFLRRGQLFAVPFDAERLETRGPVVPVLDAVAQALTAGHPSDVTGAGQFAVAATGTLAWVSSPVVPYPDKAPVTVDRRGQVTPTRAPVGSYGPALRLSPDGRQLVMVVFTLTERGVWVYDLSRDTGLTPLARDGEAFGPDWFPDGRRVAFGWLKDGRRSLAVQPADADGTAAPRVLVGGEFNPSSFTLDGRQVAALRGDKDIVMVTVENGQARVQPLIETPKNEGFAELSPDGRWLAYASDVSGRYEVYVQPYPGAGPRTRVSIDGGVSPAWRKKSGRELFFLSHLRDRAGWHFRMMKADIAPGSPPIITGRDVLFEFDNGDLSFNCVPSRCYDVALDGQSFYAMRAQTPPPPPVVTHVNLIQNWFEELKAKVPVKR
jgi:eukaryotic-like serine/threonine-protein kinase